MVTFVGATGESPELLLGERVVLKLTESIQGHCHQMYVDNFFTSFPLFATAWQDKKTVTMAAMMCQPNATTMVQRRQKDGSSMMVPCPESVVMYNQYMGGVDRGDQLRGYYHVRLKCVKNYKYIFWFLFEVAVTNAYILTHYTVATDTIRSQQTFKAFWLKLATQLIGNYKTHLCPGRPRL